MPRLGFDYDSSYTDTDPYEPQPGGCCSYLPFFIDDLVELPITLPQDHTLFSILGHQDCALWLDKARELRRRGGMVLVLSHPDYAHGAAAAGLGDAAGGVRARTRRCGSRCRARWRRWWRDAGRSRLGRHARGVAGRRARPRARGAGSPSERRRRVA